MTSANVPATRTTAVDRREPAVASRPNVLDGVWWENQAKRITKTQVAAGAVVAVVAGSSLAAGWAGVWF